MYLYVLNEMDMFLPYCMHSKPYTNNTHLIIHLTTLLNKMIQCKNAGGSLIIRVVKLTN